MTSEHEAEQADQSFTAPSPNNKMNESILSGGNKTPSPASQKSVSPAASGGASPAASLNVSAEKEDMDVDMNESQGWFYLLIRYRFLCPSRSRHLDYVFSLLPFEINEQ
jgi:hypothetical protein